MPFINLKETGSANFVSHIYISLQPPQPPTYPNNNRNQNNHIFGDIDRSSRNIFNNININNYAKNVYITVGTKIMTNSNTNNNNKCCKKKLYQSV